MSEKWVVNDITEIMEIDDEVDINDCIESEVSISCGKRYINNSFGWADEQKIIIFDSSNENYDSIDEFKADYEVALKRASVMADALNINTL